MRAVAIERAAARIVLTLHATDLKAGGCTCHGPAGPSTECPAYPEAARYHGPRAHRLALDLVDAGLIVQPQLHGASS